jgi:hypothetical protein
MAGFCRVFSPETQHSAKARQQLAGKRGDLAILK